MGPAWWGCGLFCALCFGNWGFAGSDPRCESMHLSPSHGMAASHIQNRGKFGMNVSSGPIFLTKKHPEKNPREMNGESSYATFHTLGFCRSNTMSPKRVCFKRSIFPGCILQSGDSEVFHLLILTTPFSVTRVPPPPIHVQG